MILLVAWLSGAESWKRLVDNVDQGTERGPLVQTQGNTFLRGFVRATRRVGKDLYCCYYNDMLRNVHSATEHWRDDRYKFSVLMPVSQYTIKRVIIYISCKQSSCDEGPLGSSPSRPWCCHFGDLLWPCATKTMHLGRPLWPRHDTQLSTVAFQVNSTISKGSGIM